MNENFIIRIFKVIGFALLSFSGMLVLIQKIIKKDYFIIREILFILGFFILAIKYANIDPELFLNTDNIRFGHILLFLNNLHALFFSDYTIIKIPDNFNFFNLFGTLANFFFIKNNNYMIIGNIFFILFFMTFIFYVYKMDNIIQIIQFFGSLLAMISYIFALKKNYKIYVKNIYDQRDKIN